MLQIESLTLNDFKNYGELNLEFSEGVNFLTGDNGSGKTNLLDAIYYLSMTRSFLNSGDSLCVKHGASQAIIRGVFSRNGESVTISCTIRPGQKKIFRKDQDDYTRLSDHFGLVPVVMIAPTDQELITEGSEYRRRFMDSVISQYDHQYLEDLIKYNQVLTQRNSLLRQGIRPDTSSDSFEIWDTQLIKLGTIIHEKRVAFMVAFRVLFEKFYRHISGSADLVSLDYESRLHDQRMEDLLVLARSKDVELQYTSQGIHKDDLLIGLDGRPAKKIASQGQQKSVVIALKLAHYRYLHELNGFSPIVLLDDIFDKLDDNRVGRLMELVTGDSFGQIFITDTHPERVPAIFSGISVPLRVFHVENGVVKEPVLGINR